MTLESKFCDIDSYSSEYSDVDACYDLEQINYAFSIDLESDHYSGLDNCEIKLSQKDLDRFRTHLEVSEKNEKVISYVMAPHSFWDE